MKFPQPHTGSYYAATLRYPEPYERLLGDHAADVCVVGAGFTGTATALTLAERGYDVAVVEANRVGWGASGRNGGQLIGGISGEERMAREHADLVWQMRWRGHEIVRERVGKYDIDCDLKSGYIDVAIKPRHLREFERQFTELERRRFPHEFQLLDAAAVRETIGTAAYIGGLRNMANGHLHPLNLCAGEARAAATLGARFFEQSPVLRVERGARPCVRTAEGSVRANIVVLAGNAYHRLEKSLRNHLFPVNSFIIATEPLDDALVAEINPHDLAVCDPNFLLEYFRLSADRRLLFGGRIRYFGDDIETISRRLRPKMLRIYPQLERVGIDYAWTGQVGITLNRVPQLGCLDTNIFYSQGYSGHGVNVTHLAGEIMADAVAGTMERFDVFANIRPIVIPGSQLLHRPLVSLGLMYYQLKDKL